MNAEKRILNLKKTLWKLAYARRAASHVLATCEFHLQNIPDDSHPMHIPLVCSICVTYARPFTDNAGVGMISDKFARYSDAKLQRTHDNLWESRKRFYAHTDATVTARSGSREARLQQIHITVSRQRTHAGDLFSFGYALPEMRLRGIIIPDVKEMCQEFDRRLEAEIGSTMERLFSSSTRKFKRALDKAHSDYLDFPLDFEQ